MTVQSTSGAIASALPPASQVFKSLFQGVIANPAHQDSILADSKHGIGYPDIPGHLEKIQAHLAAAGVRSHDCLVLEVNNSVRGALSVLALLDAGFSFMALPVRGQGARGGGNEVALPSFARWIVSIVTDQSGSADLAAPATYLAVTANPSFANPGFDGGTLANRPEVSPRLYFRTSGSLGAAKLAVHDYRRFCANVLNALGGLPLGPHHRVALPTPIFHLFGLGVGFLASFAAGASIDFQERGNLLKYLEREEDFNPNVAFFTPSFCETLLRGRRSTRAYEFIVSAGDRISDSTFARSEAKHGPMINAYGSTEMGLLTTGKLIMSAEMRCRTVGEPLPGVVFRIVDQPEGAGDPTAPGELQIQYVNGFEGYVDLQGNTLTPPNAFDGDWYRSGDLASPGPQGTLQVLGRCDLSLNRNGVLLPFADVENRLREIEGVEEAAVAAGADGARGRALVAFCAIARGIETSPEKLRARYAQRVPAFAVPDVFRIVDAIPKLDNGKIDRRALARLAEQIPP